MLFWHLGMTAIVVFFTLGRRRIDYRVVLLGAILPDLIDKPIGRLFFEEEFQNSRLYGHTLLMWTAVLLLVMIALRGEAARRWFILPIAGMIHLVLDGMWNHPVTLFWPLFGTSFPKNPTNSYWLDVLFYVFRNPIIGMQELIGIVAVVYLGMAYGLHKSEAFKRFVKTGELYEPRGKKLTNV